VRLNFEQIFDDIYSKIEKLKVKNPFLDFFRTFSRPVGWAAVLAILLILFLSPNFLQSLMGVKTDIDLVENAGKHAAHTEIPEKKGHGTTTVLIDTVPGDMAKVKSVPVAEAERATGEKVPSVKTNASIGKKDDGKIKETAMESGTEVKCAPAPIKPSAPAGEVLPSEKAMAKSEANEGFVCRPKPASSTDEESSLRDVTGMGYPASEPPGPPLFESDKGADIAVTTSGKGMIDPEDRNYIARSEVVLLKIVNLNEDKTDLQILREDLQSSNYLEDLDKNKKKFKSNSKLGQHTRSMQVIADRLMAIEPRQIPELKKKVIESGILETTRELK